MLGVAEAWESCELRVACCERGAAFTRNSRLATRNCSLEPLPNLDPHEVDQAVGVDPDESLLADVHAPLALLAGVPARVLVDQGGVDLEVVLAFLADALRDDLVDLDLVLLGRQRVGRDVAG